MMKLGSCGQKVNFSQEAAVIFWESLTTNIPKAREFISLKELTGSFFTLYGEHQYLETLHSILIVLSRELFLLYIIVMRYS